MVIWRLVVGVILFVVGVVLAAIAFHDARYWAAGGFIVAGIAAAASVIIASEWTDPSFVVPAIFAAVLTFFSVGDVFTSSHALNFDESKAQVALLNKFISLNLGPSELSDSERDLVKKGVEVCGLQNIRDTQQLAVDSQKAIRLGAGATLADGVNSQLDGEPTQRCLDYYSELRKTQPALFCDLEQTYPWLLKKTEKMIGVNSCFTESLVE